MASRGLLLASLLSHIVAVLCSDAGYEWAGVFATPEDKYLWTAQKVEGSYADPMMKIAVFPTNHLDEHELEEMHTDGGNALALANCQQVQTAGVITPQLNKCYQLVFKDDWWQSLFTIDTTGVSGVVIFAEHVPTEFEATAHYLKDDHGDDIEPIAEQLGFETPTAAATSTEDSKPWAAALGASFIVNLITLVGVVLLVPAVNAIVVKYFEEFTGLVSGFVAGAMMACAFFLLLFEATHLVAVGWDKEVDILWRWGFMVILGFLLPSFVENLTSVAMTLRRQKSAAKTQEASLEKPDVSVDGPMPVAVQDAVEAPTSARARIIGGILIGDFFHNFCDGVFIAGAMQGCGSNFGWTVSVATVLHEFPQELGDYAILTGKGVSLSPLVALILNFVSGLSVMLGAIVTLAMDIDQAGIGLLLAFGGGVYLHIAATECMPRTYNPELSLKVRLCSLGMFILGATLIGLVLLDHEHCVPPVEEGEADPHAGHHH